MARLVNIPEKFHARFEGYLKQSHLVGGEWRRRFCDGLSARNPSQRRLWGEHIASLNESHTDETRT